MIFLLTSIYVYGVFFEEAYVCGVKGVQARCERDVSSDQKPTFWWGKREGFCEE